MERIAAIALICIVIALFVLWAKDRPKRPKKPKPYSRREMDQHAAEMADAMMGLMVASSAHKLWCEIDENEQLHGSPRFINEKGQTASDLAEMAYGLMQEAHARLHAVTAKAKRRLEEDEALTAAAENPQVTG